MIVSSCSSWYTADELKWSNTNEGFDKGGQGMGETRIWCGTVRVFILYADYQPAWSRSMVLCWRGVRSGIIAGTTSATVYKYWREKIKCTCTRIRLSRQKRKDWMKIHVGERHVEFLWEGVSQVINKRGRELQDSKGVYIQVSTHTLWHPLGTRSLFMLDIIPFSKHTHFNSLSFFFFFSPPILRAWRGTRLGYTCIQNYIRMYAVFS